VSGVRPRRFVYGLVGSRRLGRSLGVDPLAFKTCHWNCVYCQLGRTVRLSHERRPYVPPGEVVAAGPCSTAGT
jgi:wyosine [tRNA(Phe)-imidazoG37] synthetase (radical SAM superfamily)